MLVILKMRNSRPGEPLVYMGESEPQIAPEISRWIIASDVHEARRMADDPALERWLYSMEWPQSGRHELSTGMVGESRYIMLVD